MKTFHFPNGRSVEVMTVSDVIAKLSEYPPDMPTLGAWEGVSGFIQSDSFSVGRVSRSTLVVEDCECLLIDVDRR